jgi:hypothetical protein
MTDYIIKGEAGKTLNATDRFLGADLLAVNASLRFENLGPDVLTWTCRTESITAGETIIPDVGQRVELWDSTSTQRYFRGWVTQARATNFGVQVVIEGPWQWLQKIDVTTSLTSITTDTRPTIIFNEATIASNITALLNRAIALGAPIAIGTFALTYNIPKLQLSMMSCADVLAELMRWVPDCVGWWDYSGTGSGTPTFNLSRRPTMDPQTLAVGTAALVDFDLTGRPDLVPSRVEIKYIERQTDGRPTYQVQAAGTSVGSTPVGKNQTIGLSGKELDTFLPPDDYQSYTAVTAALNTSLAISNAVKSIIPEVVASRAQFGNYPRVGNDSDAKISTGETLHYGNYIGRQMEINSSYFSQVQPTLRFTNPETGADVSTSGKYLVIGQAQPEWASGVYANAQKVRITGRLYRAQNKTRHHYLDGVVQTYTEPDWSSAFAWTTREETIYYYWGGTKPATSTVTEGFKVSFNYLDFEIEAILTTSNFATPTTIYKPQDFDYLAPPASLATNLLAVQGFTPYDGSIRLQANSLGSLLNYLQYKINITGAHSGLSTAGALVRATTYDLASQSIDLEIGAPSRFNFAALGGKVRQTPQTNITIN